MLFHRVLIFVSNKRMADRLFESLEEVFNDDCCVIHSNKTQNYRLRSIEQFREGFQQNFSGNRCHGPWIGY